MSRAAIYNLLAEDTTLGLGEDLVISNYNNDERPSETEPFAILRWGAQDAPFWQSVKAPERLTVWMHIAREKSEDFTRLISLLDRVDEIFSAARDLVGEDGYTLSFVQIGGRGPDLVDDGFNTITKWSDYQVFSRKS